MKNFNSLMPRTLLECKVAPWKFNDDDISTFVYPREHGPISLFGLGTVVISAQKSLRNFSEGVGRMIGREYSNGPRTSFFALTLFLTRKISLCSPSFRNPGFATVSHQFDFVIMLQFPWSLYVIYFLGYYKNLAVFWIILFTDKRSLSDTFDVMFEYTMNSVLRFDV